MSDAPYASGHKACKEGPSAHTLGYGFTLMRWPCGLELQIDTQLGRVTWFERMWEIHEQWMEKTNGN